MMNAFYHFQAAREHGAPDDAIAAAEEEFHAHLADLRKKKSSGGAGAGGNSGELLEDSELLAEDRELDSDNQGEHILSVLGGSDRILHRKVKLNLVCQ